MVLTPTGEHEGGLIQRLDTEAQVRWRHSHRPPSPLSPPAFEVVGSSCHLLLHPGEMVPFEVASSFEVGVGEGSRTFQTLLISIK